MDPVQMKMAARMMASMSPEDMERMTRMAAGMGGMGPAGPAGGSVPATGASGGTAAGSGMTAAGSGPASAAGVAALPAMGGFDPSSLPAGSMEEMRKRMQDPEMLKLMKVRLLKQCGPAWFCGRHGVPGTGSAAPCLEGCPACRARPLRRA
jgi:hypothetical protein